MVDVTDTDLIIDGNVFENMAARTARVSLLVDGGINEENIAEVAKAGADILVTGSAVFNSQDPENKVKNFIEVIR